MSIKLKIATGTLAAILACSALPVSAAPVIDFSVEQAIDMPDLSIYDNVNTQSNFTLDLPEESGEFPVYETYYPSVDEEIIGASAEDESQEPEISLYASVFSGGDGTEAAPYLLSNKNDLIRFAMYINAGVERYTTAYYELTQDIDFGGSEWTPIGYFSNDAAYDYTFKGVFDGKGYTVSNFSIVNTRYAGFFGLVYNGTIKNFNVSDLTVVIDTDDYIYFGGIVGRLLSIGNGVTSSIENCHVTNSKVTLTSQIANVYSGGLAGYIHSSEGATISVSDCSADVRLSSTVEAKMPDFADELFIRTGGLIGYTASISGTVSISNSFANADISAISNAQRSNIKDNIYAGGLLGYIGTGDTATITVDTSYSVGGITSQGYGEIYAGGFSGYAVSNTPDLIIRNCYSTANVYSKSKMFTSYIAGFTSVAGAFPNATLTLDSCYSSGSVIDNNSAASAGGRFVSAMQNDIAFIACYAHESSLISVQQTESPVETLIPVGTDNDLSSYAGFDSQIWIYDDATLNTPQLSPNPHGNFLYTARFLDGEKTLSIEENIASGSSPQAPSKPVGTEKVFSHWSLYPDGTAVVPEEYNIYGNTNFYANYSEELTKFTASFSAMGEIFHSQEFEYGETVIFPEAPQKPSDDIYTYTFSHWSLSENGNPLDTENVTIKKNTTYYAVYKKSENTAWDGISSYPFLSGDGTSENPYVITDAYQLFYLAQALQNSSDLASANYELTHDIDLSGQIWTPIGTEKYPFTGTFNGNGYTISNFFLDLEASAYAGIFGYVKNATITKLSVDNVNTTGISEAAENYVGFIAGYVSADGNETDTIISECKATAAANANGNTVYFGGIAGYVSENADSNVYITNCYVVADISVDSKASAILGGIVGKLMSSSGGLSGIANCYYSGNITSVSEVSSYAAGIAGSISESTQASSSDKSGNIRSCFATGSVSSKSSSDNSSYAGAIYAYADEYADVNNCRYYSKMTITGDIIPKNENVKLEKYINLFYEEVYLTELGFYTEEVWQINSDAFPVLKAFTNPKNSLTVTEFDYSTDDGTVDITLDLKYVHVQRCSILVGVYDERGKMIGFKSLTLNNPDSARPVNITITNIKNASNCTVSIVDTDTLTLIEKPIDASL